VLGAALSAYLPIPVDPINNTTYRYFYDSNPGDNYQTYGLMAMMESSSNYDMAVNDGGYWNGPPLSGPGQYYEVGQQPSYCMSRYLNQDRIWWQDSSHGYVCRGGN
jgi:hypothetical protein